MPTRLSFEERLIRAVKGHVAGRRVGFLLGAGSSYLGGKAFPLASGLWPVIQTVLSPDDAKLIDKHLNGDPARLEAALDQIDALSGNIDFPLRNRVADAIAEVFGPIDAPTESHELFVKGLAKRADRRVPVFSLNYDCLMESAADRAERRLCDGFQGISNAFFDNACLTDAYSRPAVSRGRTCANAVKGTINLYKLHGSLGWHIDAESVPRRICPIHSLPPGSVRLMVAPQQRKSVDGTTQPYASLWSEYRALLANDRSRLLNRLVTTGYGMGDDHVNAIIDNALGRSDFTLIVLSRSLSDAVFDKYSSMDNVVLVTEGRSALYGEVGPGIQDFWSFEWLAKEVST